MHGHILHWWWRVMVLFNKFLSPVQFISGKLPTIADKVEISVLHMNKFHDILV